MIIRTNSATFESGFAGLIAGSGTFATAYQPSGAPILVGPIPKPGTLALLASGLNGFGGIARQRMK